MALDSVLGNWTSASHSVNSESGELTNRNVLPALSTSSTVGLVLDLGTLDTLSTGIGSGRRPQKGSLFWM